MKCDCGLNAFFYEKICKEGRLHFYKCGLILSESKKKVKCDFLIEKYIRETPISMVVCKKEKISILNKGVSDKINSEENYRLDLNKYINLCEITKDRPKRLRSNYLANINYILNKLNFPLFFEETESLESLKKRINQKYIKKKKIESFFPIKLIDYPEYLKPFEIKKGKKEKRKIVIKKLVKMDTKVYDYEKEEKETDEEKTNVNVNVNVNNDVNVNNNVNVNNDVNERILESDNESDEETDIENNTFDVDDYESVDEYDDCDGGGFSD
tara:strand:- start:7831 stop:8637 length:807 start_codon:yes stop_codon:yes gene_type:complete